LAKSRELQGADLGANPSVELDQLLVGRHGRFDLRIADASFNLFRSFGYNFEEGELWAQF